MTINERTRALLGDVDPQSSSGLEIGPLTNPAVTPAMGRIRYLDHTDTDTLRATHGDHLEVDTDRLVPLDYAQNGRSIIDTIGPETRFDYVVASHVIEHVPDPILWLRELDAILAPGGVVLLAVPDKRRCFDILRNPSVAADFIDAHLAGVTRPTPRQVFDHHQSAMAWNGTIAWLADPPLHELTPVRTAEQALELATDGSGEYQDVHCWVFTPTSFRRVMTALRRLGLIPFDVERCTETAGHEFFVTLRAGDRHTADHEPPSVTDRAAGTDAALSRELQAVQALLADAEADRDAAQSALHATLATRSWTITRPLRELNDLRSRLAARRRR